MAKAQYHLYLSKQTKNWGDMGQIVFKGNKITPFKFDDCLWLVYSKVKYNEDEVVNKLGMASLDIVKKRLKEFINNYDALTFEDIDKLFTLDENNKVRKGGKNDSCYK